MSCAEPNCWMSTKYFRLDGIAVNRVAAALTANGSVPVITGSRVWMMLYLPSATCGSRSESSVAWSAMRLRRRPSPTRRTFSKEPSPEAIVVLE